MAKGLELGSRPTHAFSGLGFAVDSGLREPL